MTQPLTNLNSQEKISDIKRQLQVLRQDFEKKKDGIRYLIEHHDSNLKGTSSGLTSDAKLDIVVAGIRDTGIKLDKLDKEVGSLSINFDRLTTRVQNTEFQLGVTPSSDTTPVPTCRPRLLDRRHPDSVRQLELQLQKASAGSPAPPAPARHNVISSAAEAVLGEKQKEAEQKADKRPPLVYYKGGLDGVTMPAPHLDDLSEFLKNEEDLRKKLKGLGVEQPKKVGGHKPTQEEEDEYRERENQLLIKLSETNTNMVKMLEMGKGGEGRMNRIIKQKFREISKEHGYPINPRTRRVQDLVDGDHLSDLHLNWHLNTKLKETFERLLVEKEEEFVAFRDEDGAMAKALLVNYHTHKIIVGDFTMAEWREYDAAYGIEARPVYLPTMVTNHLEANGMTLGEIKELGIIEITPLLSSFSARYPHQLVLTVLSNEVARKMVDKHRETIKTTTNKERKQLFYKCQFYLPDETTDRVKRLEARQDQLRKSNEYRGYKRTNFSYVWDTENMDLQMEMTVDGSEWAAVDTSSTKSPLISTKNEWRGKLENMRMSNHHLRMLMQFRYSVTGRTSTGKKRQLKPLTDEQFEAASITAEVREKIKARRPSTTTGNPGDRTPLPSFIKSPTLGVTPGKRTADDGDTDMLAGASTVKQKQKTNTSLIPGATNFQFGKPPGKENVENSETNTSALRVSESSDDDDDFEDATDIIKVSEPRIQVPSERAPSIFNDKNIVKICNFNNVDAIKLADCNDRPYEPEHPRIDRAVNPGTSGSDVDFKSVDYVETVDVIGVGVSNVIDHVDSSKLDEDVINTVRIVDKDSEMNKAKSVTVIEGQHRIPSRATEFANSEVVTSPVRGEPSKLRAPPRPGTRLSPLKSNHDLPKVNLRWEKEASGKSIVSLSMNATLGRVWIQFWSDIKAGDLYEFDKYFVELFSIKKDLSEMTLRVKMKSRQDGNFTQVTVQRLSATELRLESKKGHIDASSIFGKILVPMLWQPFEVLNSDQDYSLEIIREEGDRKCRVCRGEWVDLYTCSSCNQYAHTKCLEKGSCKGICKNIQVTLFCHNRSKLEKDHLDQSVLYRSIAEIMRRSSVSVTKAALIKRNEETLNKLVTSNKNPGLEPIEPVVKTRIKRLESIANESIAAEEARFHVSGDKSKKWAVGKSVQKGEKSKPGQKNPVTIADLMKKPTTTFVPEITINQDLKEIIRLNLKMEVCTDKAESKGSWIRAVTTASLRDGDLGLPSAVNQLRDNLVSNIPHLGDTGTWVDSYFGGDHARYVKYVRENISPPDLDDKGLMMCAATAKVINRRIFIFQDDDLSDPKLLPAGPGPAKEPLRILFSDHRFWAMVPAELEILGEINGMEEPSQAAGKYQQHRKKGPTLTVKTRPVTKGKKDELRRRNEKAKSDLEIKLDAIQAVNDSLKCDAGELRDKMRNMEAREKTQNQYIASIERRFVNLCEECKKRDCQETAFTPTERYSISRILDLLERQEERMTSGAGTSSAPVRKNNEKDEVTPDQTKPL